MKCLLCMMLVACLLPLGGCSDVAEKRAELARAQAELQSLTYENEQMRARLPGVTKLEEDNKALQKQVYHLALEVDVLRKRLTEREARAHKTKPTVTAAPGATAADPQASPTLPR